MPATPSSSLDQIDTDPDTQRILDEIAGCRKYETPLVLTSMEVIRLYNHLHKIQKETKRARDRRDRNRKMRSRQIVTKVGVFLRQDQS